MKLFSPTHTDDRELQQIQDEIKNSLNPIARIALIDGNLIEGVTLAGGGVTNAVAHGLGRLPRIVIVVRQNTNANVWEDTTAASKKYISLKCSSACTVSLWVA